MSPKTKGFFILASAAVAALYIASIVVSPAKAADLGGNCCSDLEDRIAELEATVANKGNRKVKLVISGEVNKAVLAYKAGDEKDVAVIENGAFESRLNFGAEVQFRPGVWAGAAISIDLGETGPNGYGELITDNEISERLSYVYLKSENLGTVSIGLQSTATDDLTQHGVARTIFSSKRLTAQPLLGEESEIFNGYKANGVKYTSPTIAGFSASAAWDSDGDGWDAAIRFEGEGLGFKVAASAGYLDLNKDGNWYTVDSRTITLNLGLKHMVSGIFVQGSYGRISDGELNFGPTTEFDFDAWHAQAGIERSFFQGTGPTTIFAEYSDWGGSVSYNNNQVGYTAGGFNFYGVGINQNVAESVDLYALARRYEVDGGDEVETIMGGVRVGF